MHYLLEPIAFSFGFLSVRWYGIILGCGALAGLLLAVREGKRFHIRPDFFMDLLLIGVPSAVICARIYYVAFRWPDYSQNIGEAFKIWNGGIAIHGALIGAVIAAVIYVRYKGYNFWRIADICAPSLLIGQLIGRWGNFMNQEAYGGPVDQSFLTETLHLPAFIVNQMWIDGEFHHPTFLYESLWNLAGLLLLLWLRRRPFLRAGELFLGYFIWYSIGRFFVEGLRTDSLAFSGPDWLVSLMQVLWSPMALVFEPGHMEEGFGNVRIAQAIGVLIVLIAIAIIILRRRLGFAKERYLDPIASTLQSNERLDETASAREEFASENISDLKNREDAESAEGSESAVGSESAEHPESAEGSENAQGLEGTKGSESVRGSESAMGAEGMKEPLPSSPPIQPVSDNTRYFEITADHDDVKINPVTGEVISRGFKKKDDGQHDS